MCEERHRLTQEYQSAVTELNKATQRLADARGEAFIAAHEQVEVARTLCKKRQAALKKHQYQHGC